MQGNQITAPPSSPLPWSNVEMFEYGGWFSLMGSSSKVPDQMMSYHRYRLGWLKGRIATVGKGDTVTLQARNSSGGTGNYVVVVYANAHRSYWLEYIVTADVGTADLNTPCVLFHLFEQSNDQPSPEPASGPTQPLLIDVHPASANTTIGTFVVSIANAGLAAGQSWTSPEGFTFTVNSAGSTASVSVS